MIFIPKRPQRLTQRDANPAHARVALAFRGYGNENVVFILNK